MESFHKQPHMSQTLSNLKTKSGDIYRVTKRLHLKDSDLPFSNTSLRVKSPTFGTEFMDSTQDILQKTYYKVAHPPNRNPLS